MGGAGRSALSLLRVYHKWEEVSRKKCVRDGGKIFLEKIFGGGRGEGIPPGGMGPADVFLLLDFLRIVA